MASVNLLSAMASSPARPRPVKRTLWPPTKRNRGIPGTALSRRASSGAGWLPPPRAAEPSSGAVGWRRCIWGAAHGTPARRRAAKLQAREVARHAAGSGVQPAQLHLNHDLGLRWNATVQ